MGPAGRAREGVSAPPPLRGHRRESRPLQGQICDRFAAGINLLAEQTGHSPPHPGSRADIAPPPPHTRRNPPRAGTRWSRGQPCSPKKQRSRGPRSFHPVTPIFVRGDGHYSDLGPGKDGVSAGPGESLRQQPSVLSPTPPRRQFGSGLAPGVPWLPQHGHFQEPGPWLCQPGREVARNHPRSGAEAVPHPWPGHHCFPPRTAHSCDLGKEVGHRHWGCGWRGVGGRGGRGSRQPSRGPRPPSPSPRLSGVRPCPFSSLFSS